MLKRLDFCHKIRIIKTVLSEALMKKQIRRECSYIIMKTHLRNMKYLSFILALSFGFFGCGSDEPKEETLSINFKLTYDNDPLVMFQQYDYPQGNKIYFSRVSFYMSNVTLINDDTPDGSQFLLSSNDYIDLTNSHITTELAEEGMTVGYGLTTENIDQIFFNIGLNSIDNATVPTDHTSDNDLSLSGEYWPGWESYIFAKIEGMIDLDGDGELEQPVALHLGTDDAKRELLTAMLNNEKDLEFIIDIEKVFNQNGQIYDIATTPQIHTIAEVDAINAINFLSTGLIRAFELVN